MSDQVQACFPYVFPIFFATIWMVATAMLGTMSGWFTLQRQFPDSGEPATVALRMRSGRMSLGVAMSGILSLGACPSGLRIGIFRLFGPFQRPFLVPWREIGVEPKTVFFMPSVRLSLGRPEIGSLTVDARIWQRLAARSSVTGLSKEIPPVSVVSTGRGLLLMWLAITAGAAAFFSLTSRSGPAPGLQLAFCIGFPGLFCGAVMLVRFLCQIR